MNTGPTRRRTRASGTPPSRPSSGGFADRRDPSRGTLSPGSFLPVLLLVVVFVGGTVHASARCFGTPENVETLWTVPIYGITEDGTEDDALFGVARGATKLLERGLDEIEAAPTEGTRIRVYLFLPEVLTFPPAKLNKSFIAPSDNMVWPLRVEHREAEPARITLGWNTAEVRQASPAVDLWLLTQEGVLDMLTTNSLAFVASPGIHEFVIVAELRDEIALALLVLGLVLGAYGAGVVAYLVLRRRRG